MPIENVLELFSKAGGRTKELLINSILSLFREPGPTTVPRPSAMIIGNQMVKSPSVLDQFKASQDALLKSKRKRR